jgi:hypothetical protein
MEGEIRRLRMENVFLKKGVPRTLVACPTGQERRDDGDQQRGPESDLSCRERLDETWRDSRPSRWVRPLPRARAGGRPPRRRRSVIQAFAQDERADGGADREMTSLHEQPHGGRLRIDQREQEAAVTSDVSWTWPCGGPQSARRARVRRRRAVALWPGLGGSTRHAGRTWTRGSCRRCTRHRPRPSR